MRQLWDKLEPKQKQYAVLGLTITGLILVVSLFVGKAEERYAGREEGDIVQNVLNERTSRDIGIDAMASRIRSLEENLHSRSQELQQTREKLEETRNSVGVGKDVARQVAALREEIGRIRADKQETEKQLKELEDGIKEGNLDVPSLRGGEARSTGGSEATYSGLNDDQEVESDANTYFRDAPVPEFGDRRSGGQPSGGSASRGGEGQAESSAPSRNLAIQTISEDGGRQDADSEGQSEEEDSGIYIPSGSLMTGTLMTGLDAPTGQGARRDPFPVTVRVQKEAILPNNYSADVRDCFAILSGYGDLSSERVYLRTEGISCIRNDGQSIEARINGYAVGEDGKAGMRGRLVTKQGALIGRSMVAGFFGGMANAFNVSPVPTLDTSGDSQQIQYLDTFSDEAVQGGLVGGASNSLEKVADFWLKMADSMFPVLEVDAGRSIDFVMVKGAELKLM